jgi:hypothetical protein
VAFGPVGERLEVSHFAAQMLVVYVVVFPYRIKEIGSRPAQSGNLIARIFETVKHLDVTPMSGVTSRIVKH